MSEIDKLIELFSGFPGIGPRQAKRFVFFLLTRGGTYIDNFTKLLQDLKRDVKQCLICYRYYQKDASSVNKCPTCRDTHRNQSILMIVSRDVDFESLDKSGTFDGQYFVLGGALPILEKNPEQKIRSRELLKLVEKMTKSGALKEIIIAMSANPEGENTAEYLRSALRPIAAEDKIKISVLGRGLSTGTELEYSDPETIKNALKNRA
jgi:recombination protein RecR